jgi:hypothetical protein
MDYINQFLTSGGSILKCPEGSAKGIKQPAHRRRGSVFNRGRKAYSTGTGSHKVHCKTTVYL